ncbi:hypothetical protein [Arthrobacter glacialis]|uniref:hypothetical protein n=1 Tax=Arthrobacter glacialis TaxID=1664 RepID=UPI001A9FC58A
MPLWTNLWGSDGMVLGAFRVPPSGLPVLSLADHPVNGGYPAPEVVPGARFCFAPLTLGL